MYTIFENNGTIKKSDLLIPVGIVTSMVIIILTLTFLKLSSKELNQFTIVYFVIIILFLFIYTTIFILITKTLEWIEIQQFENKAIFAMSRLFREDKIFEFNLSDLKMTLKTTPSHILPHKKVLFIADKKNELIISNQLKGITEIELEKIIDQIEKEVPNITTYK